MWRLCPIVKQLTANNMRENLGVCHKALAAQRKLEREAAAAAEERISLALADGVPLALSGENTSRDANAALGGLSNTNAFDAIETGTGDDESDTGDESYLDDEDGNEDYSAAPRGFNSHTNGSRDNSTSSTGHKSGSRTLESESDTVTLNVSPGMSPRGVAGDGDQGIGSKRSPLKKRTLLATTSVPAVSSAPPSSSAFPSVDSRLRSASSPATPGRTPLSTPRRTVVVLATPIEAPAAPGLVTSKTSAAKATSEAATGKAASVTAPVTAAETVAAASSVCTPVVPAFLE
jgi:hypothetical protein